MSIAAIQEVLAKSHKDTFELGTVLRWTSGGKYLFAAIKSPVGWFTTSQSPHSPIAGILTFNELLEVMARPDITEVMVAQEWSSISAQAAGPKEPPADKSWIGLEHS